MTFVSPPRLSRLAILLLIALVAATGAVVCASLVAAERDHPRASRLELLERGTPVSQLLEARAGVGTPVSQLEFHQVAFGQPILFAHGGSINIGPFTFAGDIELPIVGKHFLAVACFDVINGVDHCIYFGEVHPFAPHPGG